MQKILLVAIFLCAMVAGAQEQNQTTDSTQSTEQQPLYSSDAPWSEPTCQAINKIIELENTPEGLQKIENIVHLTERYVDFTRCRRDWQGKTLLHQLVTLSNSELLLPFFMGRLKANVNTKDTGSEDTPLHQAAGSGNAYAVEKLLENGADALIKNRFRQTPKRQALEAIGHYVIHDTLDQCRPYAKVLELLNEAEKKQGYRPLSNK